MVGGKPRANGAEKLTGLSKTTTIVLASWGQLGKASAIEAAVPPVAPDRQAQPLCQLESERPEGFRDGGAPCAMSSRPITG